MKMDLVIIVFHIYRFEPHQIIKFFGCLSRGQNQTLLGRERDINNH